MTARDTTAEVARRMNEIYRAMTPQQKIARMASLTELAHSLALAHIRAEHPHETERQHRIRLCARWLGHRQTLAAFGWAPEPEKQ